MHRTKKPRPKVRRESINPIGRSPLVTPEQLAAMPPRLAVVIPLLDAAAPELVGLVSIYEMVRLLNDRYFTETISRTPIHSALLNVIVSLYSSLCVKLAALFDDDQKGVDLRRVVRAALLPAERVAILRFHNDVSPEDGVECQRMFASLTRIQRKLNQPRFRAALKCLKHARDKHLAHIEFDQRLSPPLVSDREIRTVLVYAAILTDLSSRVILRHSYVIPPMRREARAKAIALRDALLRSVTG